MLSFKGEEIYNGNSELIGCFCHNGKLLVFVPEAFRQYTLEELEQLVKHMSEQRGKDVKLDSRSRKQNRGDFKV